MPTLFNTFHIREIETDGFTRFTGRPFEDGIYLLPVPNVDLSTDLVAIKPVKGSPEPTSHWRLIDAVAKQVRRPHAIVAAKYDAEGMSRRQESLRAFLRDVPESAEQRVAMAGVAHVVDYALGALALERAHVPGDVEDVLCKLLPRAEVRRMFSATMSAYPSNVVGAGIDRAIAQEHAERLAMLEAEAVAKVEAARPNERTCEELGLVCLRVKHGNEIPALLSEAFRMTEASGASDDAARYVFTPRASLMGAQVPATRYGQGEVMPCDYVPNVAASAIRPVSDVGLRHWLMFNVRKRSRATVAGAFDYSTAEGRARIEQYRGAVEASGLLAECWPSTMTFGTGPSASVDGVAMLLSAGRDGFGIAHDLVAYELGRLTQEAWEKRHAAARREHTGRDPFVMPANPLSEEKLAAMLPGVAALFDEGELYVYDASFVEGILAKIGLDPWRETLARVQGDVIRSAEVERLLTDAGHIQGSMSPRDHARAYAVLGRLGFKKKDVTLPEGRVKAFVRGGGQ